MQSVPTAKARSGDNIASIGTPCFIDVSHALSIPVFEESNCGGSCGYATRLWECAAGMASWMATSLHETESRPLRGWRVVELGCGTALCALTVAAAEPEAVVMATDVDPQVLPLIRASVEMCKAEGHTLNVESALFDICATAGNDPLPACNLLLACDVCYTPSLAKSLAQRSAEALAASAHVIIADPGRPNRSVLLAALAHEGIDSTFENVGDAEAGCASFAEGLADAPRVRLVTIEDDARLFGLSCMPAMY